MKNRLIGISGKIGSGKDTIGIIIQFFMMKQNLAKAKMEFMSNNPDLPLDVFRRWETKMQKAHSGWEIKKFAYKLKVMASLLTGIPVEDFEKQEVKDSFLGTEWSKIIIASNPVSEIDLTTPVKMTVREMLQKVGTEAIRNVIHPEAWVNALFADYMPQPKCDVWEVDNPGIGGPYRNKCKSCYKTFDGYKLQPFCIDCADINRFPNWIVTDVRFPNEAQAIKERGGILLRVDRDYALRGGVEDPKAQHPSETALDSYQDWDYIINNEGTMHQLADAIEVILKQEELL